MKMETRLLLCCLLPLFPLLAQGQTILRNSGKMHIGKGSPGITGLYVPGSQLLTGSSSVVLNGIQRLDGDLVAGGLSSNAHGFTPTASGGKLLMKGSRRQHITAGGLPFDRTRNYLNKIPVMEVNNPFGVHLADSLALSVDTLSLVKGKFILGSSYVNNTDTRLAHFLVKDSVKYNRADTAVVEIEMVIGNTTKGREGKFMGFSPPFKRMYADYFTYNYLLAPDENGLSGANGSSISYPGYPMEAGRGYIVGQNVFDYADESDYWMIPAWNLTTQSYLHRMRDSLVMNRYSLKDIRIVDVPASDYPILADDAYTGEALNTGNVTVPLKQGYNYLGNPYTCPLDLSALKQNKSSADVWGVTRDASSGSVDIYAGFWVMHSGAKTASDAVNKTFSFSVSYDLSQQVGSTVGTDSIAPMQLFVVYAYKACNLTIPAAARTHRNSNFLKSAGIITDELLLEVRDQTTEGFDRMCVVFRNQASLNATDDYDAYKIINTSKGVSQVYTTSPDGADLITSVIPSAQASLALTLVPSAIEQEVELAASRLETLIAPEAVQLEDLKTKEIVDLTTQSYRFTTAPGDDPNRFILHFRDVMGASTGIEAYAVETSYMTSLPLPIITCAANEITINGLQKEDAGATITVSDAQGRILLKEKLSQTVAEAGTIGYSLPLSKGIYVASLSGSRSITVKFVRE